MRRVRLRIPLSKMRHCYRQWPICMRVMPVDGAHLHCRRNIYRKGTPMKVFISLVLLCIPLFSSAELRFGVIEPHDAGGAAKWQALGTYFSEALDMPVTTIRYPPNRVGGELINGSLSFALVNPVTAVEVLDRGGATYIATLKVNGGSYFAGVIVARRDRHITTVADLKGKDVLAYQKTSAGAYVFPLYHLLRNGIDPSKDLKSLRHNNRQDYILLAVQAGLVDVGFIRSGIIEALAKEGKIKLDDLVVVDERHDELPLKHTTDLYPELALLVSNKLDRTLQDRLQRAALSLRPDMPAAREAGIDGFVKPADLKKVREALCALHLQLQQ